MKSWRYALAGLVLGGALVGAVLIVRSGRPRLDMEKYDPRRAKGEKGAVVEIVEYSDFQCPACRNTQSLLDELMQKHEGKVRLYYRHFPLEGHRFSGLAHQAAECAAEQNRFWEYHDRLYGEQASWSLGSLAPPVETFIRYAREEGLDWEAFGQCLSDLAIAKRIQEERATGTGLGVRSTPSFFVNGELVVGGTELIKKVEELASR